MRTESELREALRSQAAPGAGIDTQEVLRQARARRAPKRLAVSAVSALAVVGVLALGVTSLPALLPGQSGAADSAMLATAPESAREAAGGASDSSLTDSKLSSASLCGMPLASTAPSSTGLMLAASFPASAPADGAEISGVVTLTNSGTTRVTGTTALAPVILVSRDGITVWHSHGVLASVVEQLDLAPGESFRYEAMFSAQQCEPQDEGDGQWRDDLPPLEPGEYQVSAQLTFVSANADAGESSVVASPPVVIELL